MATIRAKSKVKAKHLSLIQEPKVEIAFHLQDWEDPYNVGGMFRVAEACGAVELFMSGKTPVPPHPQIGVTSLGHHRRMPWQYFEKHVDAIAAIKAAGFAPIAVEIADEAEHYMEFDYPANTCLVLGHEGAGVYDYVLKLCGGAVFIPMAGKGRSLNVHVAAAVVAFEAILGAR